MLSVPLYAFENIFGGYWNTRAYVQKNFTGDDSADLDLQMVDTQTRIFYTAKFSDNFQFVNKFELDAIWGGNEDKTDYGDIGADGVVVEVKNSYADFTLGKVNSKIGVQNMKISRGFMFSDDAAAALVTYMPSKTLEIPFYWIKAREGYSSNTGTMNHKNEYDVDIYGIYPKIKMNSLTVRPILFWATSDDASWFANTSSSGWRNLGASDFEEFNAYYTGADVDLKVGAANVWFTGIYDFGTIESLSGGEDYDLGGYLLAVGAGAAVSDTVEVHGQTFYAAGDDDPDDNDITAWMAPIGRGVTYKWSEVMGRGKILDNQWSNGSSGDEPTNILAVNLGTTVSPVEKLSLTADLWWAQLAEDNGNGDKDLGTEIDLWANYKIMDNLSLDVLASYLFAGAATTDWDYSDNVPRDAKEKNPFEIGTQLEISF
jgi:hypothetical protein